MLTLRKFVVIKILFSETTQENAYDKILFYDKRNQMYNISLILLGGFL